MQNNNNNQNQDILGQVLGRRNVPQEMSPDELAVAAVGLTRPEETDLTRILEDTIAEAWDDEPKKDDAPVLEAAPAAPTPVNSEDEDDDEPFIRKLRPKMKGRYGLLGIPHIISTVIWIALILFIGSSLGRLAWVCAADLLALGKEPVATYITVEPDDDIDDIALKLQEAGLIRYPELFKTFVELTDKGHNTLVGTIIFDGETIYDYNALVNALSYRSGATVTVEVMIPEGYNCAQIFQLLEERGVCSAADLEAYVTSQEAKSLYSNYWFLTGVPFDHKYSLEGFLFPDTYEFYLDDEPEAIIEKMLDAFDTRFNQRLIDKFAALNKRLGTDFTVYEVIIIASIIEKESANPDESYSIASVFYNRLTHSGSYPYLNSDATILYDTDYRSAGELTTNAQINDSPYNTYTKTGLPPTPIANPGLSSLDAALDPADTSYYFFIFDEEAGVHRFSSNLAEHQAWASKLGY